MTTNERLQEVVDRKAAQDMAYAALLEAAKAVTGHLQEQITVTALREALNAWVEYSGWVHLPNPDDMELTPQQRRVWELTTVALALAEGKV